VYVGQKLSFPELNQLIGVAFLLAITLLKQYGWRKA
jgi:hypothetical protein